LSLSDDVTDASAREAAMRQSLGQYSEALIKWYDRAIASGMIDQDDDGKMPNPMPHMSATHPFIVKAGRVLAARNVTRIMSALSALKRH
jgi:hypothetical protein